MVAFAVRQCGRELQEAKYSPLIHALLIVMNFFTSPSSCFKWSTTCETAPSMVPDSSGNSDVWCLALFYQIFLSINLPLCTMCELSRQVVGMSLSCSFFNPPRDTNLLLFLALDFLAIPGPLWVYPSNLWHLLFNPLSTGMCVLWSKMVIHSLAGLIGSGDSDKWLPLQHCSFKKNWIFPKPFVWSPVLSPQMSPACWAHRMVYSWWTLSYLVLLFLTGFLFSDGGVEKPLCFVAFCDCQQRTFLQSACSMAPPSGSVVSSAVHRDIRQLYVHPVFQTFPNFPTALFHKLHHPSPFIRHAS